MTDETLPTRERRDELREMAVEYQRALEVLGVRDGSMMVPVAQWIAMLNAADRAETAEALLTFAEVTRVNNARMLRWHKEDQWSLSDWAVAMMGEAGEAMNALKKLRRVEDGYANINDPGRTLSTRKEAVEKVADELADTFLYMDIFAAQLGIDLPLAIARKFNATSERYEFPERLPGAGTTAPLQQPSPLAARMEDEK